MKCFLNEMLNAKCCIFTWKFIKFRKYLEFLIHQSLILRNILFFYFLSIFVVFDTECVMQKLFDLNWCAIGDTPNISHNNSIKFIYFDTPKKNYLNLIIFDNFFLSLYSSFKTTHHF